jgi:hypothetical protein
MYHRDSLIWFFKQQEGKSLDLSMSLLTFADIDVASCALEVVFRLIPRSNDKSTYTPQSWLAAILDSKIWGRDMSNVQKDLLELSRNTEQFNYVVRSVELALSSYLRVHPHRESADCWKLSALENLRQLKKSSLST